MKQETKDLLTWIEIALNNYASEKNNMITRDKCNKALAFLNSLPEIEAKLCRGGYIQDKNGTPCCDGDKILFCGEYYGVLRFGFMDDNDKKFMVTPHFWFDFGGEVPTVSGSIYFEKAE